MISSLVTGVDWLSFSCKKFIELLKCLETITEHIHHSDVWLVLIEWEETSILTFMRIFTQYSLRDVLFSVL